ncbi:hypothetical protein G6F68_017693 [Rhizopus microsporus]|nr:hypothetical protein G6F68_017693 [Rhizopus microsporus]
MGRLARFARILRAAAVIAVMQHPLGRERRPSHGEVSDRYRLPARWRWSAWAATIPAGSRIGTGLDRISPLPAAVLVVDLVAVDEDHRVRVLRDRT